MQTKQYLRLCVMAMLAVTVTAGWAQERLCSELPPIEREFARAFGACRDLAPIINVAPIVIPVPNVVGLTFDDARAASPALTCGVHIAPAVSRAARYWRRSLRRRRARPLALPSRSWCLTAR